MCWISLKYSLRNEAKFNNLPVGGPRSLGHVSSEIELNGKRLHKSQRRERILHELQMRPHVRIAEMAERFGVSTETVRRDMNRLSRDGLIARSHGGASSRLHYPGFDERSRDRLEEREMIGRRAVDLVQPGDTVMIDSGSTTAHFARFLAYSGMPCTILTNSLTVATTLGRSDAAEVVLCPGDYVPTEAAVVGTDTVDFLKRHSVTRCFIGATGLSEGGLSETVRGFAAIKRAMLESCTQAHLLIDSGKFGCSGLARVGHLNALASVVVDAAPNEQLSTALAGAGVNVIIAAGKAA